MTVQNKVKLVMKQQGKPFNFFGVMQPLLNDKGVILPYTPTIQFSHNANYGAYDITGSVYQQNYYMNTSNPTINVTALFSSNTVAEALNIQRLLYNFLKVVLKVTLV